MFSSIAGWYDFLNHLLSLGLDISWRKKTAACFDDLEGKHILDLACGTGDLAITIATAGGGSTRVTGGDFSRKMIDVGVAKVRKLGLSDQVDLVFADALNLQYGDAVFDGVTCAFGVRNFADLDRGLEEMSRVLAPGGRMVILEFTTPSNRLFAALYRFYFTRVLPFVGGIISGNRSAYKYLPDSVYKFPTPHELEKKLCGVGMDQVRTIPLSFGICSIHTGIKK